MIRKFVFVTAVLAFLLSMAGCERKPEVNPVAVIGADGIEWELVKQYIEEGHLPNMKKLLEQGVSSEMITIEPMLSPAIWTTIATGKLPEKHGITWFMVKDNNNQMIPVTSAQRKTKALWNIATENKRKTDVIGWWATWPAENINGRIVSDHMGFHIFGIQSDKIDTEIGSTYPEKLAEELTPLEIDPFDIPLSDIRNFMNISDLEYNVSIDMDSLCKRPEYKDCLYCRGESDIPFCHFNPLHHFLRALATVEGFNDMSVYMLQKGQPDLFMVYFEWVDVVSHQYMKFAPPRMKWVSDDHFEKYGDVIKQTYIRQDEILGELLAALAPNTNIILLSDHGFKIEGERLKEDQVTTVAKAHLWHSQPAFLVMYGPDFRKGGKQVRARVQDIAPTILTLMALPVAEDMDGAVLKGAIQPAFLQKYPVKRIQTYESEDDDDVQVADGKERESAGSSNIAPHIKEHLKALGYIGDVDDTGLEMSRAKMLLDKGKFNEAAEVAEAVLKKNPNNLKAIATLGELYFQMKRFKKAVATFEKIEQIPEDKLPPQAAMAMGGIVANWGIALMNMGELEKAEKKCKQAVAQNIGNFMAQFCLGRIAEIQQKTETAIKYYEETVRLNPNAAEAYNNLGNCYFRQGSHEKAIENYQKAAENNPGHVECHHNSGVVYQKLGKIKEAEKEFTTALKLNPGLLPSIGELASVRMELGKYDEAATGYLEVAKAQPGNPAPLIQAAKAYIKAGKKEKAVNLLRRARASNPVAIDQVLENTPEFKGIGPEDLKRG